MVRSPISSRRLDALAINSAFRVPHSAFCSDLPVGEQHARARVGLGVSLAGHAQVGPAHTVTALDRSEEHTSELQSLAYLVCRLLLEKKKKNINKRRGII